VTVQVDRALHNDSCKIFAIGFVDLIRFKQISEQIKAGANGRSPLPHCCC
jgi:hypothetical protein